MKGDGFHQRDITNPCDNPTLARQCLIEFKQACKKTDTKYCLWHGTALGAYRDRTFIENDHDIDILVILGDLRWWETLSELTDELTKYDWERLWMHPDGQCHYYKDGILIDVWFMEKNEWGYIPLTTYSSEKIHANTVIYWSSRFFDNLDNIEFMDETFPIPARIEKYLEKRYGNWKERKLIGGKT